MSNTYQFHQYEVFFSLFFSAAVSPSDVSLRTIMKKLNVNTDLDFVEEISEEIVTPL